MNFALKLKELRESKNLTQSELAYKLGVSNGCVGMWESTEQTPKSSMLIKIADYFNVTIDELLGRDILVSIAPIGEKLTASERELLADFRKLSPYLQGIALNTVHGFTGAGASDLHKKA